MQTSTIIVLACLLAVVVADLLVEDPALDLNQPQKFFSENEYNRSPRSKRGLLLLKKKLILGALGLKAAKVGAVAAAGALALKAKSKSVAHAPAYTYVHHGW